MNKIEVKIKSEYDTYYISIPDKYYNYEIEGEYIPRTRYEPAELPEFVLFKLRYDVSEYLDATDRILSIELTNIPYGCEFYNYEDEMYIENNILKLEEIK